MRFRKQIPRIVLILGAPVVLVLLVVLVCAVFRISIGLDRYVPRIEAALEGILGREVAIHGSVELVLGFNPGIRVTGIEVMNPEGWAGGGNAESFARVERVFADVDLRMLLRKGIRIDPLEVDGVEIALAKSRDGGANWFFKKAVDSKAEEGADPADGGGFRFAGLEGVAVRDLELSFTDAEGRRKSILELDELVERDQADESMQIVASGSCFRRRITMNLRGGTSEALFARQRPWPFTLTSEFGLADFTLEGELAAKGATEPGRYHFRFDIPDLDEFEPVTGPLPDPGALSFSGEAQFVEGELRIPETAGNLGEALFSGRLAVDFSGETPRIDGALSFDALEAAKFRSGEDPEEGGAGEEVVDFDDAFGHDVDAPNATVALLPYGGRLELAVGRLTWEGGEAGDLTMVLDLEEDAATLEGATEFGKNRVEMVAELRRAAGTGLELDVGLESRDVEVGEVLEFFFDESGVTGGSDRVALRYKGAGENWKEIAEGAEMGLSMGNSLLAMERGGESVELRLISGSLRRDGEGEGEIEVAGILQGEDLSVEGSFSEGRDEAGEMQLSCDLEAAGAGARARIQRRDGEPGYVVSVMGERLADLGPWIGAPPGATIAYSVEGRLISEGEGEGGGWGLEGLEGRIGADRFSGRIGQRAGGTEGAKAALEIELDLVTVDLEAIKHAFAVLEEEEEEKGGLDIDLPILPGGLQIADADVKLEIERLLLKEEDLTDVRVEAVLREGWVQEAPFEATFGETQFRGDSSWDFRGDSPKADFRLKAENVVLGRLLGELGVIEPSVKARAESMELVLQLQGGTLREILQQSSFEATMKGGSWKLRDSNTKGEVDLAFEEATVVALAGEPLRFELKGRISDAPLSFSGESDGLEAFAEQSQDLHLHFETTLGGTRLVLDEQVALPLDRSDFSGDISLKVHNLSELDDLVDVRLPPWGPCSLTTHLRILEDGYAFENFEGSIGKSDLAGTLRITTKGVRPRFTGNLKSRRFQIEDFHKEGWSPYGSSEGSGATSNPGAKIDAAHARISTLLSAGTLSSFDGKLSLEAGAVYSGSERLGDGSFVALLESGKLRLGPASLNVPGGMVRFEFDHVHRGSQVESGVVLKVRDFDYGIIARRKDPATKTAGKMNLDVEIKSLVPGGGKFLANGNGRVGVSFCPDSFGAAVFDLWATNLLFAVVPRLDPESKSKVNCVVGEFTLANGLMTTEQLLIDATRVRAEGSGTIDFKKEIVDLDLIPAAKTPQVLNLATAITIDGSFESFGKRVTATNAIKSLSGASARTVLFPLRFLTQKRMPEDGSDICPCLEGR